MKAAFLAVLLLTAACAAAEPAAQSTVSAPAPASSAQTPPAAQSAPEAVNIVDMPRTASPLHCAGAFVQGGIALCRTEPGASIFVSNRAGEFPRVGSADENGWFVVGFDRFDLGEIRVRAVAHSANHEPISEQTLTIAARTFGEQRVDGLPQQTVTPTDPAVLARIAREREIKNQGFASRANLEGWLDGFVIPTDGRVSSSWGNRRILNGVPNTPHYGVDIAAPDGTPIHAPASGVVSLAEPDLHYEGGLVFIDHGQGLISMYLHMSRLDVHVGDHVTQGQLIGAVGHAGRATGPHLCWRMKWRDRNLDPSVALTALAAARTQLAQN